jgi:hypothetical protein
MKKKIVIITLFIALSFGIGSLVGAQTSIVASVVDKANREIGATGMAKKEAIVGNLQEEVATVVQAKLGTRLAENKTEVEQSLQAYYDEKLANIENTEEFKAAVTQLDAMTEKAIAYYKAEIDKAFAGE